jgi:hydroxymethylpyrimidine pyrophosphatase-like HAD family hydrolase
MPVDDDDEPATAKSLTAERSFGALAVDYDNTLADHGTVSPRTLAALRRARQHGCKVLLVTGREIEDLRRVFPEAAELDIVVAENGAVLYTPGPWRERLLATPPPPELAETLRARGVMPLTGGRIVVATKRSHEGVVRAALGELGLKLAVIANRDDLMVLPAGVDKASGLRAALADLGVDPSEVVGVGDAENDQVMLDACGLAVAVANAIPELKHRADVVTFEPCGAGVVEVVDRIVTKRWPSG